MSSPPAMKRHRVKPGIYFQERARGRGRWRDPVSGRTLSGSFLTYVLGSEGKTVWKTFDKVTEAEHWREEKRSRKRGGERVVSSRARFREFADEWLAGQTQLRERTREAYDSALRVHLYPRFGHLRVAHITEDDAARLIREMQAAGYAPATILTALRPLSRVLSHAARRGLIPVNPLTRLERGERPRQEARERRVLDPEEIARLLAAAPERYRLMLDLSVTTGIRQGELLGLTWADVDTASGVLTVRMQLDRHRKRVALKTRQARREIELPPSLLTALREHKAASLFSQPEHFVFCSGTGTALNHRNVVSRGLDKAIETAGLNEQGKPKLRWHDLRHTALSGLITDGIPLSTVARIAGHANTAVTGRVYAHEIEKAEQGDRAREAMERRRVKVESNTYGSQRGNAAPEQSAETAYLRGIGTHGN